MAEDERRMNGEVWDREHGRATVTDGTGCGEEGESIMTTSATKTAKKFRIPSADCHVGGRIALHSRPT